MKLGILMLARSVVGPEDICANFNYVEFALEKRQMKARSPVFRKLAGKINHYYERHN
jgi:hypothetical protein